MTTTAIERIKAKTLAIEIKRSKIPREPVDITTCSSAAEALDKLAAGSTDIEFLNKYGKNVEGKGSNWDTAVSVSILPNDSKEVVHICTQFNRMKSIPPQHRSHGRTTGIERKLMAYFRNSTVFHVTTIAEKFSVSVPTVYYHASKTTISNHICFLPE